MISNFRSHNPQSMPLSAIAAILLIGAFPLLDAADNGITNVRRLSPLGGSFSFARFTQNGRFVLAAASGEPFGKCEHIFRFDLARNGHPISLVSTGMGWEQRIGGRRSDKSEFVGYSLGSTAAEDWKKIIASRPNARAPITEAALCSASICDITTDTGVRAACKLFNRNPECLGGQPHIERRRKSLAYRTDNSFQSYPMLEADLDWQNVAEKVDELTVWSQKPKGGVDGEEIVLLTEAGRKTFTSAANWADGFVIDDSKSTARILYAGGKAQGFALNALNEGIIPTRGAKLFQLTELAAANPKESVLIEDSTGEFSYLAPSVSRRLPGVVVYTKVRNNDGKAVLVKMEQLSGGGIRQTELTEFATNSRLGQLSPDGKYLTFISDRGGAANQLYVATMGNRAIPEPEYPSRRSNLKFIILAKPPVPVTFAISKHLTNPLRYAAIGAEHRRLRITPNLRTIMYETEMGERGCIEVHQLRIDINDGIVRRRLSSGVQSARSPNWLNVDESADVLMAAELLEPFLDPTTELNCQLGTCEYPVSEEMRKACKTSPLPSFLRTMSKNSELVRVDQFGMLKERITFNDVWDGEVRVSPERNFMVFERKGAKTYELWRANLDGSEAKKLQLPEGPNFAFDLAFSHDSKFLVYAAYRPETDQQKVQFETLFQYDTVDVQYSNLYIYDLNTNEETKFINGFKSKTRCRSPIYIQEMNRVAFQYSIDGYNPTYTYAGSYDFDDNKQHAIDLRLNNQYTDHLIYKQDGKYRMVLSDFSSIFVGEYSIEKPAEGDPPKPRTEPTEPPRPPTSTPSSAIGNRIATALMVFAVWLFV